MTLILYEKNGSVYTEVDSATASANSNRCTKTVSYPIESGKTYKLQVIGKAYVNGAWDAAMKDFVATF